MLYVCDGVCSACYLHITRSIRILITSYGVRCVRVYYFAETGCV